MAGRPSKQLRFGDLLHCLQTSFSQIANLRDSERVSYSLSDILTSAFALFFLQDSSLLAFQRRIENESGQNNMRTVFGVENIPSDTQLRDTIDDHENTEITGVFKEFLTRLQRSGQLKNYKYLNEFYLVALDGSDYFSSDKVKCNKCLTKKLQTAFITTIRFSNQQLSIQI